MEINEKSHHGDGRDNDERRTMVLKRKAKQSEAEERLDDDWAETKMRLQEEAKGQVN